MPSWRVALSKKKDNFTLPLLVNGNYANKWNTKLYNYEFVNL